MSETETPKPELLPCPFCGAQAKSWLTSSQGAVYCDNLECFGPRVTATYRSDAVVQWNKRASTARKAALREALERIAKTSNAGFFVTSSTTRQELIDCVSDFYKMFRERVDIAKAALGN